MFLLVFLYLISFKYKKSTKDYRGTKIEHIEMRKSLHNYKHGKNVIPRFPAVHQEALRPMLWSSL